MSNTNCEACDELRNTSADYVQNGVTDAICASLQNDTGLNPSLSHNDAQDMHNINDCTIGKLAAELEAYDVCDWKEFMLKFLPNLYEFNKAVNCVDAGQWAKINEVADFAKDICEKTDMIINPSALYYGVFPYNTTPRGRIGQIGTKNGQPLLIPHTEQEIAGDYPQAAGVGIYYAQKKLTQCSDGACRIYEWLEPWFYKIRTTNDVEYDDILWYASKQEIMDATGMTEGIWQDYIISSWTWTEINMLGGDHRYAWIQLTIDPDRMGTDYLTLVYKGSSYPNGKPGVITLGSSQGKNFWTKSSSC